MVRRLPVLQTTSDEAPQRPRWHYLAIGAGFTVTLWLPLAMVATWVGTRIVAPLQPAPLMLSYILACFASAVLVGRFGGKAGEREAILGNLLGSAVVLALVALASAVEVVVVLAAGAFLVVSSVLAGWAGARLGRRLRH
jgi:hypothetical protein